MAPAALLMHPAGMPRRPARASHDRRPGRNYIRAWREHRGLTQEQLGDKTGMAASNISLMENARSGYSWQSLEDIAAALECAPGDLLSGPPAHQELVTTIRGLPDEVRVQALDIIRILTRRR
jgi:transcriptional regulator with XRE-family HTH domain